MGGDKIYMLDPSGANGGNSDILAMLPALMQQRGVDPNILALMNGKNGSSAWGGDGIFAILLLFILMGAFGNNGFGGFGGNNGNAGLPLNMLSNDSSRELIMSAIQRNGLDISQLASGLHCSIGDVQTAINGLSTQICNLAGQQGLSSQQIINAIQSGNAGLASQLASCCCDVRTAIERQGYESQLAIVNQTNTLNSNSNTQFNIFGAKIDAQTQIINDRFCQLEMREMQNKIDTLRQENTNLALAASQQAQTAKIVNQLKAQCPVPAYIVANPNCCTIPTVATVATNGCGGTAVI